jgi:hypothetical protein
LFFAANRGLDLCCRRNNDFEIVPATLTHAAIAA